MVGSDVRVVRRKEVDSDMATGVGNAVLPVPTCWPARIECARISERAAFKMIHT